MAKVAKKSHAPKLRKQTPHGSNISVSPKELREKIFRGIPPPPAAPTGPEGDNLARQEVKIYNRNPADSVIEAILNFFHADVKVWREIFFLVSCLGLLALGIAKWGMPNPAYMEVSIDLSINIISVILFVIAVLMCVRLFYFGSYEFKEAMIKILPLLILIAIFAMVFGLVYLGMYTEYIQWNPT